MRFSLDRQTGLAVLVGLLLVAFGGWGNYEMYRGRAWPTVLFLLVMLLGLAVWGFAWWAHALGRRSDRRAVRALAERVGILSLVLVAGSVSLFVLGTGVERVEAYAMTWEVADDPRYGPVRLRPIGFEGTFVAVEDEDAVARLESLGADTLCARLRMTYDFGRLRGWHIASLAGFEDDPLRTGVVGYGYDLDWPPSRLWGGPGSSCEMP